MFGLDETRRFPIFSKFQIEVKSGEVILITGDSGSGKSTLLHEISTQIASLEDGNKEFPNGVVSNSSIEIDPNEVLIEGVGKDTAEAIKILSMAGLNEAFLMLRKYKQLSDGQKYRYHLAKMIDSESDVWVFDEFCAVLDRTTAKVVSYALQKMARKLSKTVIVATTHEDLVQDLKPDTWVTKGFGDAVNVKTYTDIPKMFPKNCTLLHDLKVLECTHEELKELEKFHYRGSNAGIIKKCFKAVIGSEIVAGIMFVYPHMALRGRNAALPEFRGKVTSQKLRKINKEIVRISRVIVSPRFRSIGLGAYIVRVDKHDSSYDLTSNYCLEALFDNACI